jgi:hypothetical protein
MSSGTAAWAEATAAIACHVKLYRNAARTVPNRLDCRRLKGEFEPLRFLPQRRLFCPKTRHIRGKSCWNGRVDIRKRACVSDAATQ